MNKIFLLRNNLSYYLNQLVPLISGKNLIKSAGKLEERNNRFNQTGYDRKVPIPIDIYEDIYAFPTHSPKNFKCSWLFPTHIRSITPDIEDASQSKITFHNGRSITLNTNAEILNKQMHFATYCMYLAREKCIKRQTFLQTTCQQLNLHAI
ncbi:MAG: competence protein ComK [Bacillus sp. (in: Bacteria)]|nr:competence protein ComK [Bacillus sp. (in: firmicutes)]